MRASIMLTAATALLLAGTAAPAAAADLPKPAPATESAPAAASTGAAAAPAAAAVPQNDDLIAVLWDQTSVEAKGAALGAYALARIRLDELLADKTSTAAPEQTGDFSSLPPAVVLDIDDTVLNTSAYQAWTVTAGTSYSGKTWTDYVKAQKDVAIPGAIDFTKYAASKGVKVFFVSNRTKEEEGPTVEEMAGMGFPVDSDGGNVLSAGEQPDWKSAKGTRRTFIAKNYRIVLAIGDNMGDFTDEYTGSVAERDAVYQKDMAHWGHDWIVISNPTYGSFQSAPFLSDYSKSANEQRQLEEKALTPWAGPSQ